MRQKRSSNKYRRKWGKIEVEGPLPTDLAEREHTGISHSTYFWEQVRGSF